MARLHAQALAGLFDGHRRVAREDFGKGSDQARGQMLDEHAGHGGSFGQCLQNQLKGLDATVGSSDSDDGEDAFAGMTDHFGTCHALSKRRFCRRRFLWLIRHSIELIMHPAPRVGVGFKMQP